jgi:integrase
MGIIYDRHKDSPEKGPKIYIKFKNPRGVWQYRRIGHINPKGLTKAQLRTKEKDLRKLAADILTKIEGDIVAGRYGLDDQSKPQPVEPAFKELAEAWVERRFKTHRDGRNDRSRVRGHLIPFFGPLKPSEITTAVVKSYIETKQAQIKPKLGGATIRLTLMLLSRFFNDRIEGGAELRNPVTGLDRTTRRRVRSNHDPRMTPFLHRKEDIRAVYLALKQPYRIMFAVGVFAGLRDGEILALDWERDIDLKSRRIHVQWQVKDAKLGRLKDGESRVVPILNSLLPVLEEWKLKTGGVGLCFPPVANRGGRRGSPPTYRRQSSLLKNLRAALKESQLSEALTWYQCTRHTFASHWVMDGRPIERLREILGHSTVKVTERYAHLRPGMFTEEDLEAVAVDLREPKVIRLDKERRESA